MLCLGDFLLCPLRGLHLCDQSEFDQMPSNKRPVVQVPRFPQILTSSPLSPGTVCVHGVTETTSPLPPQLNHFVSRFGGILPTLVGFAVGSVYVKLSQAVADLLGVHE